MRYRTSSNSGYEPRLADSPMDCPDIPDSYYEDLREIALKDIAIDGYTIEEEGEKAFEEMVQERILFLDSVNTENNFDI